MIGGAMNDWRFVLVACIGCVLVWAAVEGWLLTTIRKYRLRRNDRCVSTDQAIAEDKSGLGRLLRNRSMLPGKWWLLRTKDRREDCDLVANLKESGFLVECKKLGGTQANQLLLRKGG